MKGQFRYPFTAFLLLSLFFSGYFFAKKLNPPLTPENYSVTDQRPLPQAISGIAARGKTVYMQRCASCHPLFKDLTGPALINIVMKSQWQDRAKLYKWIRNPVLFMRTDSYTQDLKKKYLSMMTAFPDLSDGDIDAIVDFVRLSAASRGPVPITNR